MFTGIISDLGSVGEITRGQAAVRFKIITSYPTDSIKIGESIACNGCCLTVTAKGKDTFSIDASKETLDKTTLGSWVTGSKVNLERALEVGDALSGHLVAGHIDGVAEVVNIQSELGSKRYKVSAPQELMKFIAPKGSVALDGVSLTVNEVGAETFGVNIIPHTQVVTTLGDMIAGRTLNLEIDLLARYVSRSLEALNK
ncbi:MAG: riboflavin synthase [Candidatus Marinimicrobia bacterium]|nr:riboflavin synthase [Candidatus Neomarinimicrobiota bacterium]